MCPVSTKVPKLPLDRSGLALQPEWIDDGRGPSGPCKIQGPMSGFASWSPLGVLFVVASLSTGSAVVAQDVAPPFLSPIAEARIAAKQHPHILKRFGGEYGSRQLSVYVDQIGKKLVRAHRASGFQFKFSVVDSPDVFAFAQTGGYVYISRAMLSLANSEDQVAAVLAHEISHVLLRHGAKRDALKTELDPHDAGAKHHMSAFTRDQELAADAYSIPMLLDAKYDPFAQGHFLSVVRRYETMNFSNSFEGGRNKGEETHPTLAERAAIAIELAQQIATESTMQADLPGELPGLAYHDSGDSEYHPVGVNDTFLSAIDGMIFGRRPGEGMAVGNTYVNARARFTFDIPPGFHFTHTGRMVMAEGPGGATMRFDSSTRRRTFNSDLVKYLARNTGHVIEEGDGQMLEINGLPGALAHTVSRRPYGDTKLHLAVVQGTSRTLFRFTFWLPFETPGDVAEQVWSAPLSFRRLTRQQARAWKPLRLKVVTVLSGMTAASLAAQMPMADDGVEWFSILNNLAPGDELSPGQRVKIVIQ